VGEAAPEFPVRPLQSRLRLGSNPACNIGHHEEDVTNLFIDRPLVTFRPLQLSAKLTDLLLELGKHFVDPGPVETDPRRLGLQLVRFKQTWQPGRDSLQQ